MAEIVVAHPHHFWRDPGEARGRRPVPPLGVITLAQRLRRAGHDVALYDATFEDDPRAFGRFLDEQRPARVVLAHDPHHIPAKLCLLAQREASTLMIAEAAARGIPLLAGGPDASDHPEHALSAGAAVVIRGECDVSAQRWCAGEDPGTIPGAVVRGGPSGDPAPAMALHDLPLADWDLVDLSRYAAMWREAHGFFEAPVSASRGCPFRCDWCAKPIWGRGQQARLPEDVVADARELAARGADRLWMADDLFALKPAWLRAFRAEVERVGGILPYRCQSRADLLLRPGVFEDLAASGCAEVWVGAESGAQVVLDAMKKDTTVAELHAVAARGRALGVRVGFFLQLGYPEEGLAELEATFRLVREARPDEIGVSVSYPLPGTPFFERVKHTLKGQNWSSWMENETLHTTPFPRAFYAAAREALRREHALTRGADAISGERPLPLDGWSRLRRYAALPVHAAALPASHLAMRWHARKGSRTLEVA